MPYSDTCKPLRTAISRRAALCLPEPVKCCSRLPSWLGLAIRRSTLTPEWVRPLAPLLLAELTLSISGSVARLLASVTGLLVTAIRSMSLTLSAMRLAEPAISTWVPSPPRAAQALGSAWPSSSASGSSRRGARRSTESLEHPLQRLDHARLELCAKPLHGPKLARKCRFAQRIERVDAKLCVQQPRPLGPEPGQARDRDQPGGHLRAQLLRRRDRARVEQREDLLLERRANARQLGNAARARQLGHRHRRLAHSARRVAVGEHTVHDRAIELVQVAKLFQRFGDRRVGQLSGHGLTLGSERRQSSSRESAEKSVADTTSSGSQRLCPVQAAAVLYGMNRHRCPRFAGMCRRERVRVNTPSLTRNFDFVGEHL